MYIRDGFPTPIGQFSCYSDDRASYLIAKQIIEIHAQSRRTELVGRDEKNLIAIGNCFVEDFGFGLTRRPTVQRAR